MELESIESLSPYSVWISIIFIIGYVCIATEHIIKINKATTAILMATVSWALVFSHHFCAPPYTNTDCFLSELSQVSQIIFFLMGALTIVELISLHQGFKIISDFIHVTSKRKLLWVMGFFAFFLSSILDNLTTTIVLVSLLQKLVHRSDDRLVLGGGIVIAANAGGVWTPIGDVTTTMLWIGNKLSVAHMMLILFTPSIVCLIVSLLALSLGLKGNFEKKQEELHTEKLPPYSQTMLYMGMGALVFVPIFKVITGLPPFMGMLFGLSVLWFVTDLLHRKNDVKNQYSVPHALSKVDYPSTLFFLGILLCVGALDYADLLDTIAIWFDQKVGNITIIATFIGIASAIVDNVPLVAAGMRMYDVPHHPPDSHFWDLIAYCAGTGGSILVIGSAAGVVYMGMEKVNFFWYLRKISLSALIGYLAGIGAYLLLNP